jgi:HAD superfamily hydrolase (TIGR01450 family)
MRSSFQEIISNYDALIVDLWGVIHDGDRLYPGVADTLRLLHELNKPVVFLSNAPRVSAKAQKNLDRLGIPRAHYLEIVTSGQVAHDLLARMEGGATSPSRANLPPAASGSPSAAHTKKTRYYYLGPSKDEDILSDLHAYEKADEAHADFILCTGYEFDGQPHEEIIPLLAQLIHLPMLCVNPDMEVVKQDGTEWLCAGRVAAEFSALGGRVSYIGKPFGEAYQVCKLLVGNSRTLCVGDNPITDIKGANDAGFDSLLITGGVMKTRYGDALTESDAREVCRIAGVTPTYVLDGFVV